MANNSPQTNVVLGLDGNMYKLDTAFKRGVSEQVVGKGNYSPQSCLMEDEDGKIYNILDLLAGNKIALTPEQIKGYPMSPKSGIVSNHDGTIGSLVTAFLEAGGTLTGKAWIPYFLPDGKLAWKDYLDGLNPPVPTNIKGEKGIDGLNFKIYDTNFSSHTIEEIDLFAQSGHTESFDKSHITISVEPKVGDTIGLLIPCSSTGHKSLYLGIVQSIMDVSIVCDGRGAIHSGLKGDIGLTGPKGDVGDTGPQGIRGEQGIPGPKGDTGATGPQGTSLNFMGIVHGNALISQPKVVNNMYLVDDGSSPTYKVGKMYVWNGSIWKEVCQFVPDPSVFANHLAICDTDFAAHTTAQLNAFAVFNHMESFDKTHILTAETITVGGMIGLMIQNSDYGTKSLYLGYVSKITGNSIECYGRYCIHTPNAITHNTTTLTPNATYNSGTLKISADSGVVNVNGYIELKAEWHMGETMFTLPVGFRPTNLKSISMWLNNVQIRLSVGNDGQVTFLETMSGTIVPTFRYSFHFSFII